MAVSPYPVRTLYKAFLGVLRASSEAGGESKWFLGFDITAERNRRTYMDYEFTAEQNRTLADVAADLSRAGKAILSAGILTAVYVVLTFVDPRELMVVNESGRAFLTTADYMLWVLIALLVIYVSITVIRLAVPLKLIATTSGKDISHLMEFMKELGRICRICSTCLIVACVLLAASIGLAIVVF